MRLKQATSFTELLVTYPLPFNEIKWNIGDVGKPNITCYLSEIPVLVKDIKTGQTWEGTAQQKLLVRKAPAGQSIGPDQQTVNALTTNFTYGGEDLEGALGLETRVLLGKINVNSTRPVADDIAINFAPGTFFGAVNPFNTNVSNLINLGSTAELVLPDKLNAIMLLQQGVNLIAAQ